MSRVLLIHEQENQQTANKQKFEQERTEPANSLFKISGVLTESGRD